MSTVCSMSWVRSVPGRARRPGGAGRHPPAAPPRPAGRRAGGAVPGPAAGGRGAERRVALLHRAGLLRLCHAERDSAQRAREPRLVHTLHAVPGRGSAGAPRGAAELPDHGRGPDGHGCRERVAARRGDRSRRGDDVRAPHPRPPVRASANRFVVSATCFPQTIAVVRGRAEPLGIEVVVADPDALDRAIGRRRQARRHSGCSSSRRIRTEACPGRRGRRRARA